MLAGARPEKYITVCSRSSGLCVREVVIFPEMPTTKEKLSGTGNVQRLVNRCLSKTP